jgi:hypothetical protein
MIESRGLLSMKPVYCNQFFMSKNPYNSEVILEMKHGYVEHEISSENNKAVAKATNKMDDVISVCMTQVDAIALRDSLDKIIGDYYTPEN